MRPEVVFLLAFAVPFGLPLVMPTRRSLALGASALGGAIIAAWAWQARAVASPSHVESLGDPLVLLLVLTSAAGLVGGLLIRAMVAAIQRIGEGWTKSRPARRSH